MKNRVLHSLSPSISLQLFDQSRKKKKLFFVVVKRNLSCRPFHEEVLLHFMLGSSRDFRLPFCVSLYFEHDGLCPAVAWLYIEPSLMLFETTGPWPSRLGSVVHLTMEPTHSLILDGFAVHHRTLTLGPLGLIPSQSIPWAYPGSVPQPFSRTLPVPLHECPCTQGVKFWVFVGDQNLQSYFKRFPSG